MINKNKCILILAAAGSSSRLGIGTKKEYLSLKGGTVLSQSALVFLETKSFSRIIVTCPKEEIQKCKDAFFKDENIHTNLENCEVLFIEGGQTRQESVYLALEKIHTCLKPEEKESIVLIHDAARPFVTKKIITDVIDCTIKYGAAVPAIPPVDTQKEINSDNTIKTHLQRSDLIAVQTPQGFNFNKLFTCHKEARKNQKEYTDDTEIWDQYSNITKSEKVHIVAGDKINIKITYKKDLDLLDSKKEKTMMRIGFGTDLHKLEIGRKLILGGVIIPSEKGELAHSDGDVLLHAIMDSLLGASGLGDIGSYFPPEDDKWKDSDSKELLKKVWTDVQNAGWTLNNMDCVLEFEKPKFLPWKNQVIESISEIMNVDKTKIYVKAKTNEKLDAIGNEQAIKAYCTCLLTSKLQE